MSSEDAPEVPTVPTRKPHIPQGGEWHATFLDVLRACGTVRRAAEAAKVDRSTAYEHRNQDEGFRRQWDEAIEDALDRLELQAYVLAMGQPAKEARGEEPATPAVPPSERMIIFLLQSRRKQVYGNVQRLEHTGGDGGPIVHDLAALAKLPLDELARVYRESLGPPPEAQP